MSAATTYQIRVRGLCELPPKRIKLAPANFRTHPLDQRERFRGLAGSLGVVGAVLAWVPEDVAREALRATPRGDAGAFAAWLAGYAGHVQLFDGAMRRGELRQRQPVLVADLDEAEAALALATFDPIGDQAGRDDALLRSLLSTVAPTHTDADKLIADLRASLGEAPDFTPGTEDEQGQLDRLQPIECPACHHRWTRG